MSDAELYFLELTREIPDVKEGKMFGALCMKTPNGKSAAMMYSDNIVVKLEGAALSEALHIQGAKIFEPMEGRPMNNWVQIPYARKEHWRQLAVMSVSSVKELKENAKKASKKK